MCKRKVIGAEHVRENRDNLDCKGALMDKCGWQSPFCVAYYLARFKPMDPEVGRRPRANATYWFFAWILAITYPLWGLISCFIKGWYILLVTLVLAAAAAGESGSGWIFFIILGLGVGSFFLIFYLPGILYAYACPFIYAKVKPLN